MIDVVQMERARHFEELRIFGLREPTPLDLALENLAPQFDRGVVLLDAQPLTDLVTRAPRAHMRQPVTTRLRRRRRDDLDRLGILELARQTGDSSVDARTLTVEPDFGVNGERKIDRRRALGQLDYIAGWSKDEDFVLIQIELEELEEFVRSLRVELQLEHLPEPLECAIELVSALPRILLESPVRRDSILGGAVHLARTNLDLEQLAAR